MAERVDKLSAEIILAAADAGKRRGRANDRALADIPGLRGFEASNVKLTKCLAYRQNLVCSAEAI